MDRKNLEEELNEILNKLHGCDIGSEEYKRVLNNYRDLYSILDKENISELKMLEYRRQLEKDDAEIKAEADRTKSKERIDCKVKWIEVVKELAKTTACIGGTAFMVIIIGELDKTKVLPGKLLSLATRMLPKI